MTFHNNEMTPWEVHGTLLRMATDQLEERTEDLVFDVSYSCIVAEELLRDIIARRMQDRILD